MVFVHLFIEHGLKVAILSEWLPKIDEITITDFGDIAESVWDFFRILLV